ncbi:uncharacterized protein LOC125652144 [Ostrea edulis]|uniref:uncharacterized protein LOC125652144 n=1 Tax=Ostrea edulis TaxID=37623 RepID=UPI0024AEB62E|nr:uncharacterized protein LOC125652144 [Ostrea edulis]
MILYGLTKIALLVVILDPGKLLCDGVQLFTNVGRTLYLRCDVTTSHIQFVWIKEQTTMASGPPDEVKAERNRLSLSRPRAGIRELTINDVRTYDAGNYLCIVTLTNGTRLSFLTTVQVKSLLTIETTRNTYINQQTTEASIQDEDITTSKPKGNIAQKVAFVGETVVLSCPVYSSSVKFGWQKNGILLAYGPPDTVLINEERISISAATYGWRQLVIKHAVVGDSGIYLCVVEQGIGSPFKMSTDVRVVTKENSATTSDLATLSTSQEGETEFSAKQTTSTTSSSAVSSPTEMVLNNTTNLSVKVVISKSKLFGLLVIAIIICNL